MDALRATFPESAQLKDEELAAFLRNKFMALKLEALNSDGEAPVDHGSVSAARPMQPLQPMICPLPSQRRFRSSTETTTRSVFNGA